MKTLLYLLIIISLSYSVYVPVIPPPIPNHDVGCYPPINFSIEHDCDLQYDSAYAVNTMKCVLKNGNYYNLKIDCIGGIISSEEIDVNQINVRSLLVISVIIILPIIIHFTLKWLLFRK